MRRRVLLAALTSCLAGAVALVGAPAAAAAPAGDRLPIATGPSGVERTPAGVSPRIIGGSSVANGQYPFQAALLLQSFGANDRERQFCGGSLISRFHVLTAAHCVDFIGAEEGQIPVADMRVVVGRTVLSSNQGQKRKVVAISTHPRWAPETFDSDVAVLTLDRPVTGIRPIALVTPGTDVLERPGTRVIVTGWGNTIAQPPAGTGEFQAPDRMQQVRVPIVSRVECRTAYAAADAAITATQLCAGSTDRDTCQGDSGGPLFVKAVGAPGHIQVGITSWGFGCGATGFPGVYTRLGNRSIGNFVLTATGNVPARAS